MPSHQLNIALLTFTFLGLIFVRVFPDTATSPTRDIDDAKFTSMWEHAATLHTSERYVEAEVDYKRIFSEFPDSQRTALRIAIVQGKQGKIPDAIQSFNTAYNVDPYGSWAPVTLFYLARFASENDDQELARSTIDKFYSLHPDSPYKARCSLLLAELDGKDTSSANRQLDEELRAATLYDEALSIFKSGDYDTAADKFSSIANNYPNYSSCLQAKEALGHIYILKKDYTAAEGEFLDILADVGLDSPDSRIAQVAKERLAALSQLQEKHHVSLSYYEDIISTNANKSKGTL